MLDSLTFHSSKLLTETHLKKIYFSVPEDCVKSFPFDPYNIKSPSCHEFIFIYLFIMHLKETNYPDELDVRKGHQARPCTLTARAQTMREPWRKREISTLGVLRTEGKSPSVCQHLFIEHLLFARHKDCFLCCSL